MVSIFEKTSFYVHMVILGIENSYISEVTLDPRGLRITRATNPLFRTPATTKRSLERFNLYQPYSGRYAVW